MLMIAFSCDIFIAEFDMIDTYKPVVVPLALLVLEVKGILHPAGFSVSDGGWGSGQEFRYSAHRNGSG
jgi:hypothetical protein